MKNDENDEKWQKKTTKKDENDDFLQKIFVFFVAIFNTGYTVEHIP